jgi:hypothetical protein
MPVSLDSIAVGKCFVTSTGQVRRVLKMKDGKVTYESRGKTDHGGSWGAWKTVGDGRFANDVDREVTSDWNSDYPERAP